MPFARAVALRVEVIEPLRAVRPQRIDGERAGAGRLRRAGAMPEVRRPATTAVQALLTLERRAAHRTGGERAVDQLCARRGRQVVIEAGPIAPLVLLRLRVLTRGQLRGLDLHRLGLERLREHRHALLLGQVRARRTAAARRAPFGMNRVQRMTDLLRHGIRRGVRCVYRRDVIAAPCRVGSRRRAAALAASSGHHQREQDEPGHSLNPSSFASQRLRSPSPSVELIWWSTG